MSIVDWVEEEQWSNGNYWKIEDNTYIYIVEEGMYRKLIEDIGEYVEERCQDIKW